MTDPFATDEDLFEYALIHSQTELALFHRDHVRRIWELAGCKLEEDSDGPYFPKFVSIDYETMKSIVADARERLKQKEPTTP